ncbi:MAG: hypothetical protein PHY09_12475 [Desulfuromonadaceae bacterium]|nr:hypothetical protein [Desulfuromonadaceae bacterium]MDD5107405.1 hypothetical protein [Desulfuromonadaceae bacterium]
MSNSKYFIALVSMLIFLMAACGGGGGGGGTPPASDTTAPIITNFSLPATSTSRTVSITRFIATDAVKVTGYFISEEINTPTASAFGWSDTVPSSFTFSSAGTKTVYVWAKDAAGNVSSSRSASVTITLSDTVAPVVSSFSLPVTAVSLTVSVSGLSATDSVGVTGYLINESASTPNASATVWSTSVPTSYTFSSAGTKTAYAWAKDAAGNVSSSRTASVTITLADAIAPTVTSFSLPATATSLTVPVSGLAATDAVGVTGYLITESATAPSASATGWSASAPTSYIFSSAGTKTAYAWAKDAAGNVSSSRTASVSITPTLKFTSHSANSGEQIGGFDLIVILPVGCSVTADATGVASSSAVYLSGQFAGEVPQTKYYDAASRTLTIMFASPDIYQLGEFLTILITVPNGYVPNENDIIIATFAAYAPTTGNPMPSVSATASYE